MVIKETHKKHTQKNKKKIQKKQHKTNKLAFTLSEKNILAFNLLEKNNMVFWQKKQKMVSLPKNPAPLPENQMVLKHETRQLVYLTSFFLFFIGCLNTEELSERICTDKVSIRPAIVIECTVIKFSCEFGN